MFYPKYESQDCRNKHKCLGEKEFSGSNENNGFNGYEEQVLARAYIPFQENTNSYSGEEALARGTLYKDLDRPYSMFNSKV